MADTITSEVKEISKDVRKNYGVGALLFLIAIIAFGYYLYKENTELKGIVEKANNRADTMNTRITVLQMQLIECNEELKYTKIPIKKKK
jgi:hypothetical protein